MLLTSVSPPTSSEQYSSEQFVRGANWGEDIADRELRLLDSAVFTASVSAEQGRLEALHIRSVMIAQPERPCGR